MAQKVQISLQLAKGKPAPQLLFVVASNKLALIFENWRGRAIQGHEGIGLRFKNA